MKPVMQLNGLPEPDLEIYVRDDVVADTVPPEPSPAPQEPPVPVPPPPPPPRPDDEPLPGKHGMLGSFRLGSGQHLQACASRGEIFPLMAFPNTVPEGSGFREKSLRGHERTSATNGLGYKYYEGFW